jgi:hypothetical protein
MNKLVITFSGATGFHLLGNPADAPEGAVELVQEHQERLRALLDKPVILTLHWEDGAKTATCTVIPACEPNDRDKPYDEPFQTFELAMP